MLVFERRALKPGRAYLIPRCARFFPDSDEQVQRANIEHPSLHCNTTMDEGAEAQAPAPAPAPAKPTAAPALPQNAVDHPHENGDGAPGHADMQENGGTSAESVQSIKRQRRNKPSLSCEACTTKKTKVSKSNACMLQIPTELYLAVRPWKTNVCSRPYARDRDLVAESVAVVWPVSRGDQSVITPSWQT